MSVKLNEFQKASLFASIVAVVLLLVAIIATLAEWKISYGFYVFLRLIVCGSMVALCFDSIIPNWLKYMLGLQALLYNPVIRIHLGDREVWMGFNVVAIAFYLVAWALFFILSSQKRIKNEADDGPTKTR